MKHWCRVKTLISTFKGFKNIFTFTHEASSALLTPCVSLKEADGRNKGKPFIGWIIAPVDTRQLNAGRPTVFHIVAFGCSREPTKVLSSYGAELDGMRVSYQRMRAVCEELERLSTARYEMIASTDSLSRVRRLRTVTGINLDDAAVHPSLEYVMKVYKDREPRLRFV